MAATGNGTTQYLATVGTISPPTSTYSVSFWYKPASAPGSANVTVPFAFHNGANTYVANFTWNNTNALFRGDWAHINASTGVDSAKLVSPGSGAWMHIAITFDGATLKAYINGVLNVSVAATAMSGSLGSPNIFVCAYDASNSFDPNPVAEAAIWNTALTQANVTSLFNGSTADTVGSGLVFYDKLNTGVATVTGPTLTNHSTVLNTTYFLGFSGGLAIGSATDMPVRTQFHFDLTGGLAIGGGSMPVGSVAIMSASMTMSGATGRAPVFEGGMVLTGAFTQPECHGAITAGMQMRGEMRVTSGSLANGRASAYTTR